MSDIRRKDPGKLRRTPVAAGRTLRSPRIEAARLRDLGHLVGIEPIDLELPDLDDGDDIIADNVKVVAALYFVATLEELELFAVVDKIAEQFMSGALPISRGDAGDRLYQYLKGSAERLTASERSAIYASTVNNDAFRGLWLRFLGSVAAGPTDAARAAGRALAVHASAHGSGVAHVAAVDLQAQLRQCLDILGSSDVHAAYGVRDTWQLVERVRAQHLGGGSDLTRGRVQAQAGSQILLWLAAHAAALSPGGSPPLSQIAELVARWLAVAGDASRPPDL